MTRTIRITLGLSAGLAMLQGCSGMDATSSLGATAGCESCPLRHPFCDGNTVVVDTGAGACTTDATECDYSAVETRTPCKDSTPYCAAGTCVAQDPCASGRCAAKDPCAATDCSAPPPRCDGTTKVSYSSAGICQPLTGVCEFAGAEVRTPCTGATPVCQAGACLERLTLVGTSSIANARVEVTVGSSLAETSADETGSFRIDVGLPTEPQLLRLVAFDRDNERIVMASLLPNSETLRGQAGTDATLTHNEQPGVRISALTTAIYGTLRAAIGHEPENESELIRAEQLMSSVRSSDEIVDVAALVELLSDNPFYAVPSGHASILTLVEDLSASRSEMDNLRGASGGDPIAATRVAMLADRTRFPAFGPTMEEDYSELVLQRNGYVGFEHARWSFASRLDSEFQPNLNGTSWDRAGLDWTWANGAIDAQFVPSATVFESYMAAQELAAFFPWDAALHEQLRTDLNQPKAWVDVDVQREVYRSLYRGLASELVHIDRVLLYRFATAFADGAYDVTDATKDTTRTALWLKTGPLPQVAFTLAEMLGTWVLPVLAPADRAQVLDEYLPGDPLLRASFVEFHSDGTAAASGGVIAGTIALDWSLTANGGIEMVYPGGELHRIRRLVRLPSEDGLYHELVRADGHTFSRYERAAKVDAEFTFSAATLVNSTAEYWRSTVNRTSYLPKADGTLPGSEFFGFVIADDGTLDRLWVDDNEFDADGNPVPAHVFRDPWDYELEPDRFLQSLDPSPWVGNGPTPIVMRQRSWRPVAMLAGHLLVLEAYISSDDPIGWVWDEAKDSWVDQDGNLADPATDITHDYIFAPRLNSYHLDDLPKP